MSHQQIGKTEAAAHAATEQDARAAYKAAYAGSLRRYEADRDHAAFSARNKAASDVYRAAIEPAWTRRADVLDHIDD